MGRRSGPSYDGSVRLRRRVEYRAGDLVIYRKEKHGTHPGPRARDVWPAPSGDTYNYLVDKCWIVVGCEGDRVRVCTPTGKTHDVAANDPHLRRPSWRERVALRLRSPERLRALRGQASRRTP